MGKIFSSTSSTQPHINGTNPSTGAMPGFNAPQHGGSSVQVPMKASRPTFKAGHVTPPAQYAEKSSKNPSQAIRGETVRSDKSFGLQQPRGTGGEHRDTEIYDGPVKKAQQPDHRWSQQSIEPPQYRQKAPNHASRRADLQQQIAEELELYREGLI